MPSDGSIASLVRLAASDERALANLFGLYRKRLRRMVQLRLDPRLQGRLDPSDVLQDVYLDVAKQLPYYLSKPGMDLFLWLRLVAGHRLMRLHRQHLGTAMRDAGREISIDRRSMPAASSASMAVHLFSSSSSPSQAIVRVEVQLELQKALEGMDPFDREIIVLRHFEELTNAEAAEELGLPVTTASKRYVRAMKRLQSVLKTLPGLFEWY
jgi:RNA polymerase sigma-70 factor, ECF subfamily